MGYAAIGTISTGQWEVLDESWQFVRHDGHPQQAHGEPYPTAAWIVNTLRDIYRHRVAKQYRHADALRQWLRDYGMRVEYEHDRVRVFW